jgi:hypothetical protein
MNPLFPVFKTTIDEEDQEGPNTSWLTIGSSFDDSSRIKKEAKPTFTAPQAQSNTKESKNYYNLSNRMTAQQLINQDSDSSSEEEKKKKKKHKKKKDK